MVIHGFPNGRDSRNLTVVQTEALGVVAVAVAVEGERTALQVVVMVL